MNKAKFPLLLVLFAAIFAGCGGGSASLKTDDVATVGNIHVSKAEFDALIAQAKRSYSTQTPPKAFPKPGTADYETIKGQAVTLLVQQAEREQKAASMGIKISDSDVQKRLDQIKKQYFSGSETKYQAQLKKQNLSDAQVRADIRQQLISEAVFNKVTTNVKVSDSAVHAYYIAHPTLYSQPQSRDVRHILVKSPALAHTIYLQLKSGNDKTWCTLAKKYSQDPSSKNNCGKLTVSKGQTVPEFDKVAFTDPAKTVHVPVHSSQYGWFVIEPLSPIKPKSSTPEKQVANTIRQQLLGQDKNQAMTDWVSSLSKSFCSGSKIKYQVGYAPTPDPCTATTNPTTT
ncbi:MAG TPA: SurA N-terminal domain-containing protein [Gaiellaceae bacterium]|jgi:parvulin-like peptidyl-prolyl isomerase|nr:SurA N-terminal domain-containing protein [Gaiellaceae bacterium]